MKAMMPAAITKNVPLSRPTCFSGTGSGSGTTTSGSATGSGSGIAAWHSMSSVMKPSCSIEASLALP